MAVFTSRYGSGQALRERGDGRKKKTQNNASPEEMPPPSLKKEGKLLQRSPHNELTLPARSQIPHLPAPGAPRPPLRGTPAGRQPPLRPFPAAFSRPPPRAFATESHAHASLRGPGPSRAGRSGARGAAAGSPQRWGRC